MQADWPAVVRGPAPIGLQRQIHEPMHRKARLLPRFHSMGPIRQHCQELLVRIVMLVPNPRLVTDHARPGYLS